VLPYGPYGSAQLCIYAKARVILRTCGIADRRTCNLRTENLRTTTADRWVNCGPLICGAIVFFVLRFLATMTDGQQRRQRRRRRRRTTTKTTTRTAKMTVNDGKMTKTTVKMTAKDGKDKKKTRQRRHK